LGKQRWDKEGLALNGEVGGKGKEEVNLALTSPQERKSRKRRKMGGLKTNKGEKKGKGK